MERRQSLANYRFVHEEYVDIYIAMMAWLGLAEVFGCWLIVEVLRFGRIKVGLLQRIESSWPPLTMLLEHLHIFGVCGGD